MVLKSKNSLSQKNALTIEKETAWLSKLIDNRLESFFEDKKFKNLDDIQHFISHKIESIFSKNLNKKDIDISFPDLNGTTIARIDVEKSDEPIFVSKNGEEIFFVREIDGTKKYEAEKLAGYLISNFK